MKTMKIITVICIFLIIILTATGSMWIIIQPIVKAIRVCEDRNWDGSPYVINEGKRNKTTVLCNRNEQTDAIVKIYNSFFFMDKISYNSGEETE